MNANSQNSINALRYRDRVRNTMTFFAPLLTLMGDRIQRKEGDRLQALRRRLEAPRG